MGRAGAYDETIVLPQAVRFPVELDPPLGFDPADLATWPMIAGRLEYVDGRLLYMPPTGDTPQDTVADVVLELGSWARSHPELVLGTNEAGMHLGGETRAADAALWRRADLGPYTGGLRRTPPLLAVEVAGREDRETTLREKAAWYLAHGVPTVWLVLPEIPAVIVVTASGDRRLTLDDTLPEPAELPGLRLPVRALFHQRWG